MEIVEILKSFYWAIFYRIVKPDLSIWWQFIENGELHKKSEHAPKAESFSSQFWLPYEFWQTISAFSKLAKQIIDYELFYIYANSTNKKALVFPEKNIKTEFTKNLTKIGLLAISSATSNNFFVRLKVFKLFLQQKVLFLIVKTRKGWYLISKTQQLRPILLKRNTILSPTLLATKGFIVYTAHESFRPFNKITIQQGVN